MDYKELAKVFYMDSSSNREANLAAEEARRRDSVGTFRLGYETQAGELFLAVPKELSALTEQVLRTERKVTALLNGMNLLAANAVLRGLVFDEVVFTNASSDQGRVGVGVERCFSASFQGACPSVYGYRFWQGGGADNAGRSSSDLRQSDGRGA